MTGESNKAKKKQSTQKEFRILDKFKKILLLEDAIKHRPEYDTFITIALSHDEKEAIRDIDGEFDDFCMIRSFLVPIGQKKLVLERKFNVSDISDGNDFFEMDGSYNTGETFEDEESGVKFEIIANIRTFDGIESLYYFEPTDRLIRYLKLHRNDSKWINPLTNDSIIETEDKKEDSGYLKLLKIRKSELIDYLAARQCGLLILRYSERRILTPAVLAGLPAPFEKETTNGKMHWIAEKSNLYPDVNLYVSELWDSFWIDPAKNPRRCDAQSHDTRKGTVSFQLGDGEHATFEQVGENRFLEVISFKPSLLKSFISLPKNKIEFYSISTLGLIFSNGSNLVGCINKEGQFQTFFGQISKHLDLESQRSISSFSEPQKAKISKEYYRTQIGGNFPETVPFKLTLCNCLNSVNVLWSQKCGETLLLSPKESEFKEYLMIGPISQDFEELLDIMLEFRKLLIPEGNINKIKEQLDYSSLVTDKNAYKNIKSIGFTKLFFKANSEDQNEGKSYILSLINELRQCKGHAKDLDGVFDKYGKKKENPKKTFLLILAEICEFLTTFKELTEKCFNTKIEVDEKSHKSWIQLDLAHKYFENPD